MFFTNYYLFKIIPIIKVPMRTATPIVKLIKGRTIITKGKEIKPKRKKINNIEGKEIINTIGTIDSKVFHFLKIKMKNQ